MSIGQFKREISELVSRVACGGERIVLTSRGKPKAALVSMQDYARLGLARERQSLARWQAWIEDAEKLSTKILERRTDEPLDVQARWQEARADLEARDDRR